MNALVTGASRGIGLEFCRQLLARGEEVIAACRTPSAALKALGVTVEAGVDVSSDDDVHRLAKRLGALKLDLLINNAGILLRETLDDLDFAQMRRQFEVNALGPLRVTKALLPTLQRGSKVILITSRMGSIGDNTSGSRYGYRMSKAALNMAGMSLAHDLRDRGVAVAMLHPGFVRTDMTEQNGNVDVAEAVRGLLTQTDALSLTSSGGFWHADGESLPW